MLAFQISIEKFQGARVLLRFGFLRGGQVRLWQDSPTVPGDRLLTLRDDRAQQIIALLQGVPHARHVAEVSRVESIEVTSERIWGERSQRVEARALRLLNLSGCERLFS